MAKSDNQVYIAGPFFNNVQMSLIQAIEKKFDDSEIKYFSPRSFGSLGEMGTQERLDNIQSVYTENIRQIENSMVMLAVIDDNDVGTVFEMGYAACLKAPFPRRKIVTMSDQGYGMNIMLRECVDAHLHGMENVAECIWLALENKLDGDKFMADRGEAW